MDHPVFQGDSSLMVAWIDLIESAAFKDTKHEIGGRRIPVKRGQCTTAYRFLAKRWHWSLARVQRFLGRLRAAGMIVTAVDADTGFTMLTICNYDRYQFAVSAADTAPIRQPVRDGKKIDTPSDTPSFPINPESSPTIPTEVGASDTPSDTPKAENRYAKRYKEERKFKERPAGPTQNLEGEGNGQPQRQEAIRAIVSAWAMARDEIFGALPGKAIGGDVARADFAQAAKLLDLGATPEIVRSVAQAQCSRMKVRRCDRPKSIAIIHRDVLVRITEERQVAASDPDRDRWLPAMTCFADRGPAGWIAGSWGEALPGEARCRMPSHLQAESLAAWQAKAGTRFAA
jgi:hypothetical protein